MQARGQCCHIDDVCGKSQRCATSGLWTVWVCKKRAGIIGLPILVIFVLASVQVSADAQLQVSTSRPAVEEPSLVAVVWDHGQVPPKSAEERGRLLQAVWDDGDVVFEQSKGDRTVLRAGYIRASDVTDLLRITRGSGLWTTKETCVRTGTGTVVSVTVVDRGRIRTAHTDAYCRSSTERDELSKLCGEESATRIEQYEHFLNAYRLTREAIEKTCFSKADCVDPASSRVVAVREFMQEDPRRQVRQEIEANGRAGAMNSRFTLWGSDVRLEIDARPLLLENGVLTIPTRLVNHGTAPVYYSQIYGAYIAGEYEADCHGSTITVKGDDRSIQIQSDLLSVDEVESASRINPGESLEYNIKVKVTADMPNPIDVGCAAEGWLRWTQRSFGDSKTLYWREVARDGVSSHRIQSGGSFRLVKTEYQ